ncbi:MAG: oligosaccharide flippase family protein [Bacteroides sp.]|nr:oligosaccharide flippase family protein [Bacteroides sp.]
MNIKKSIKDIAHSKNFKHGIYYALFSFANSGISFILVLILARYLGPSEYGRLNLFNTFVTFCTIFISLSSASYIAVSYFQRDRETLQKIIAIVVIISTAVLIILSGTLLAFPGFFNTILGIPIRYQLIGVLICYFTIFNNINLDIWRIEEKPVQYGLYSLSFALCNFALTFWLIVCEHYGWEGRVYAWGILAMLYFVISVVFLNYRKYLVFAKPTKILFVDTILFSLPLLPHSISFWFKQSLDRYILNYFYSAEIVGYFSFAMNLAAIITILGNAFNATYSVYLFKKLSGNYLSAKPTLDRITKLASLIFAIAVIIVSLLGHLLIKLFMTKYGQSTPYIIPLCIGGFFQCLYYIWSSYLIYYKKTALLMKITVGMTITQVGLSILLTRYSPLYAAWISMFSMGVTVVLVHWYKNKVTKSIIKPQS